MPGSAKVDDGKANSSSQQPQPKWRVLRVLNYFVLFIFVGAVWYGFKNYRDLSSKQLTNSYIELYPYTIVVCSCLVYFFGFFGISFLDTDSISQTPSTYGLTKVKAEAERAERERTKKVGFKAPEIPAPRNDTPICAEISAASASKPAASASAAAGSADVDSIDFAALSDEEVFKHLISGNLKDYQLEKKLGDYTRAVVLRRLLYENILGKSLEAVPYAGYDYNKVFGANCEIVVGYVPIPVGIVGPLLINGETVYVPMATTEGCLVASTNRGCKAISASGGCFSVVLKDAITRAPCLKMPSAMRAAAVKRWVEVPDNYYRLEEAFNSTTSYGRLDSVDATVAGRNVYLRFCCMSGDAMGMNMVSKGCLKAMEVMEEFFPDMVLVAISGNMCTDKKPSAINWILGRGKSVVVEAVIPEKIVTSVLKSSVHDMIETNKQKNHIGSAMAGSIGGFNAHAANIVTAVFLATGQDPAQNVESSNCITIMDFAEDGKSLQISVTMPSIEVGTVGGGTHLPAQAACLEICGTRGAARGPNSQPGDNSRKLAQIVGASVLAGELSLMAALAANHLVRSHMQHNRKPTTDVVEEPSKGPQLRKIISMPALSGANSQPISGTSTPAGHHD